MDRRDTSRPGRGGWGWSSVAVALVAGCETPSRTHDQPELQAEGGHARRPASGRTPAAEDDCAAGGRLFKLYCGSCHNARPLGERPFSNYQVAMTHMRDQAYLTGKEYRQIMHFLRRWDNVGPPTPPVEPSPKRFVFSQPISELRGEAAEASSAAAPPPTGPGPWQPPGAPRRCRDGPASRPPRRRGARSASAAGSRPPVAARLRLVPTGLAGGGVRGSGGLLWVGAARPRAPGSAASGPRTRARSCRNRASKSSEGRRRGRPRRGVQRPDEGDQVAGLLAGQLVPERRHPGPLAVEHAHDQLGIGARALPGAGGEVRDARQAVPHLAPAAVAAVARGAGPLEESGSLRGGSGPPGRVVRPGGTSGRVRPRERARRIARVPSALPRSSSTTCFPPRNARTNATICPTSTEPSLSRIARHRLPLALEDRAAQFGVAPRGVPRGIGEIRDLRHHVADDLALAVGVVTLEARGPVDPDHGRRRGGGAEPAPRPRGSHPDRPPGCPPMPEAAILQDDDRRGRQRGDEQATQKGNDHQGSIPVP